MVNTKAFIIKIFFVTFMVYPVPVQLNALPLLTDHQPSTKNSTTAKIPHNHPKTDFVNSAGNCSETDEKTSCGTIEFLGCTGSKKFYHESAIKMNWFESWEYCRSIGLHLAAIENRYEQTFIEIFLPKLDITTTETYWTSGTDLGKEGQFTWMATGRSLSYANFRAGEPNNRFGSEDCIELVITPGIIAHLWNDRNCLAKAYALCQQDVRYPDKLFGTIDE